MERVESDGEGQHESDKGRSAGSLQVEADHRRSPKDQTPNCVMNDTEVDDSRQHEERAETV
jgi:hypothetical protein